MLTIGKLAKLTGAPASAIRFYEKKKIIKPSRRTESGYRVFDESTIKEIIFLKSAQSCGLKLQDIAQIGKASNQCQAIQKLLLFRQSETENKILELKASLKRIRAALQSCKDADTQDLCKCL